ncbi:hypothetical protein [Agromyces bauzanensis]|uniref:Secreted protein n=1 Tax=Agromyces bauzanensis TaxID=1308924 RepID=A0A917PPT7_9MICO|nr:hypothetical protein [Agromyces bauzanensis]GGJ86269.1 hypothetical protein GCM10011372_25810 [Agromyces bauzanensis]
MDILIWVLVSLLVIVVLSIATVVFIARALIKRIRRNRNLAGAMLRTRAWFSSGPQRRILTLRVRLGEALGSGQAAVDLAARGDGPRGELPRLFRRINDEGVALDLQLRLMESETDAGVLAVELPAAGHRVDQVVGLVRRLRSAVAAGLAAPTDDTLTTLQSDVDREIAALHAGVQELQRLNRGDERFEPTRPSSTAASIVRDNKGTRS